VSLQIHRAPRFDLVGGHKRTVTGFGLAWLA
jgi:hypothetical protein